MASLLNFPMYQQVKKSRDEPSIGAPVLPQDILNLTATTENEKQDGTSAIRGACRCSARVVFRIAGCLRSPNNTAYRFVSLRSAPSAPGVRRCSSPLALQLLEYPSAPREAPDLPHRTTDAKSTQQKNHVMSDYGKS